MELVAAGMCGGSPEAVEQEWTMPLYTSWLAHCEKWGPPAYVSVAAILGIAKKKTGRAEPKGRRGLPPPLERPQEAPKPEQAGPIAVGQDPRGFIDLFTAAGGRVQ